MSYYFKAASKEGFVEEGFVDALNETAVMEVLLARGLTPYSIRPQQAKRSSKTGLVAGRVKVTDLYLLIRELATLLDAGVDMVSAIQTLAEHHQNGPLGMGLQQLFVRLQQGQALSESLAEVNFDFPHYVYALVKAGEATGQMASCLNSAADQMEFDLTMRRESREAMVYPMVLVASGVAAIGFIFAFVVPRFAGLLEGKGVDLPYLSMWVLSTGKYINQNWQVPLLALAGLLLMGVVIAKNKSLQGSIRHLMTYVPIINTWLIAGETARWTSMLSVLLAGKVPILNAVELAASSVQLPKTKSMLNQVGVDVRGGKSLSSAIAERLLLDPAALAMLKVGEKSGAVTKMMTHVSAASAMQYRTMQRRVITLVEPVSILLIGGVLGIIMIGVVLAMTSLTEIKL